MFDCGEIGDEEIIEDDALCCSVVVDLFFDSVGMLEETEDDVGETGYDDGDGFGIEDEGEVVWEDFMEELGIFVKGKGETGVFGWTSAVLFGGNSSRWIGLITNDSEDLGVFLPRVLLVLFEMDENFFPFLFANNLWIIK